jgi:ABC-2 type transport system ATP-binding protein
MEELLVTERLSKSFRGQTVVDGVSMRIRRGEIYGFLGPNGAGKTTVMRMLTNLVKPSSGTIELFGRKLTASSYELMKRIGSMIEYPVFYDHLSALENLEMHGEYMGYYDKAAMKQTLELTGLADAGRKPVKHYSLGMRQRLGIARAISTRPELLILDEPVNGMDPLGIRELRELFRKLKQEYGMTLLVSSHILQEIEQLADTIGVIDRGRLVEEITMARIRSEHSEYIEAEVNDGKLAALVLEEQLQVRNYKLVDPRTVRVYSGSVSPSELARALLAHGIELESLNRKNRTLEQYYLNLTGGGSGHDQTDPLRAAQG